MIRFDDVFWTADIVTIYKTDNKDMSLPLICDVAQDNYNPDKSNMIVIRVEENSFTVYVLDLELTDKFRFRTDDKDYIFSLMVDENEEPFAVLFENQLVKDYGLEEKIIKKD